MCVGECVVVLQVMVLIDLRVRSGGGKRCDDVVIITSVIRWDVWLSLVPVCKT